MPSTPPYRIAAVPSFGEALRVWLRIGLLSFGGPAGQIALMHRILVEEKRWVSDARFLHALNYCMLLPGPEAQQLATYLGWLLHRTLGGIVAGVLFILPGLLLMLAISVAYVLYGDVGWMRGLLFGLQAATLAIVVEAVLRLGRRALKNRALWGIAAAAFIAIFAFGLPFPLIVTAAALIGLLGARLRPALFLPAAPAADGGDEDQAVPAHAQPRRGRSLRVLTVCALLWFGPIVLLFATVGADHVYTQESVFFSKMAVVTFGGAYAVLAYMTQQAVEHYGWVMPGEMVQGLALAETTPGPLILVLSYVGFLGAWRDPGNLPPVAAGLIGATLSTWVTFVPCFLWIFLGAPYIERLRGQRALNAALTGITAAVVGVILNLSLWFAVHVLFRDVGRWEGWGLSLPLPDWHSLDPAALLLGAGAMLAMLRWQLGLMRTLLACALAGLGVELLLR
jgi:chromate transporter